VSLYLSSFKDLEEHQVKHLINKFSTINSTIIEFKKMKQKIEEQRQQRQQRLNRMKNKRR
jgi:hypothetical protein